METTLLMIFSRGHQPAGMDGFGPFSTWFLAQWAGWSLDAIGRKFEVAFRFCCAWEHYYWSAYRSIISWLCVGPLYRYWSGACLLWFGWSETWFDAAEEQRSTTNVGAEGFQRRWEPPFLDLSLVILLKQETYANWRRVQMVRSGF